MFQMILKNSLNFRRKNVGKIDKLRADIAIGDREALETEEKRLDIAVNDLKVLLGITGSPVFIFHKKWNKAIPQYNVGYGEIKSKFQRLEKDNPGLYFTGNYREGISVADTMLQAIQTADNIIKTDNN